MKTMYSALSPQVLQQFFPDDAPRPLAKLTKAELFTYPEVDARQDAYPKFLKEIIARRAMEVEVRGQLPAAQRRLATVQASLARARTTDTVIMERLQQNVERAKAEVQRIGGDIGELSADEYLVTHENIVEYFRAKAMPAYEQMIMKWNNGALFHAQHYGWTAFLQAEEKQVREDKATFKELERLAAECTMEEPEKENDSPEVKRAKQKYAEIRQMWSIRIFPSPALRKRFLDSDGQLANVRGFQKDLQREYWSTWINYNRKTLVFEWSDATGMAYDSRAFNFEMTVEEQMTAVI